jgi:hypothetical protein
LKVKRYPTLSNVCVDPSRIKVSLGRSLTQSNSTTRALTRSPLSTKKSFGRLSRYQVNECKIPNSYLRLRCLHIPYPSGSLLRQLCQLPTWLRARPAWSNCWHSFFCVRERLDILCDCQPTDHVQPTPVLYKPHPPPLQKSFMLRQPL